MFYYQILGMQTIFFTYSYIYTILYNIAHNLICLYNFKSQKDRVDMRPLVTINKQDMTNKYLPVNRYRITYFKQLTLTKIYECENDSTVAFPK